jgi:hypothetical protein
MVTLFYKNDNKKYIKRDFSQIQTFVSFIDDKILFPLWQQGYIWLIGIKCPESEDFIEIYITNKTINIINFVHTGILVKPLDFLLQYGRDKPLEIYLERFDCFDNAYDNAATKQENSIIYHDIAEQKKDN